jgi:hypothetical protein
MIKELHAHNNLPNRWEKIENGQFILPPRLVAHWKRLDDALGKATSLLIK